MTPIEQYRTALSLAHFYHADQLRVMGQHEGKSYFECHILPVCRSLSGYAFKIVGALHDILEDTHCTIEDLQAARISPIVIKRVNLLTHYAECDVSYQEYIDKIIKEGDAVVIAVKIADLINNLSHTTDITAQKNKSYLEALSKLRPAFSQS